jgi:ribonuclease HII
VKAELRAEHRADETYLLVGAASIVAKVARDAHVAALAEQYGDVGSGYPSDPATRAFLADYVAEHGELPPCARKSWSTCDDVLAAAEQSSLREF